MEKALYSILILLFIFAAIPAVFCQNSLPPDIEKTIADINTIHGFYPRLEGSEGEKKLIRFITKRLEYIHARYSLQDFSNSDLVHSFSKNIVVDIPGRLKDTLILAVPLNHSSKEPEKYDGSINIAIALAFIQQLMHTKPPVSVKVVFLGAEYGEGSNYPMGSRLFLRDFEPDYKVVAVYMNIRKAPSRLYIGGGAKGIVTPYWLLDKSTTALKKTDIYFLVRGNENQIFRMGLTKKTTIIEPYLKADYPAISFSGEYDRMPPDGRKNFIFSFNLFLNTLLNEFKSGFPESWDKHYLFFQAKNFYFIIPEENYIIILLAMFLLSVLYALIFPERIKRYVKTIKKSIWTFPVILSVTFVILTLSTLILEGITYLRRFPTIWEYLPLLFLAEKAAIALFLYAVLYNILKKLPFSRNGSFYSASALLFFLIDTVILAVINISFTYYFLWAFFFALLFTISPYRIIKVLLFLASPYWIIKATLELFTLPSLDFCRVVLFSRIWGNILLAVIIVPFIFLLIRLGLIVPPARRARRKKKRGADKYKRVRDIAIFFGFLSLLFFTYLFIFFKPFNGKTAQPIAALETINITNKTNNLIITSPAPIGEIEYRTGKNTIKVNTKSRKYITPLQGIPSLIHFTSQSVAFLNRNNYELETQLKGNPSKVEVVISSNKEFVLYDANFPFKRDKSGKSYSIFIGVNPPVPLILQFTLPKGFQFDIRFKVNYRNPPVPLSVTGKNKKTDVELLLFAKHSFKT